MNEDNLNSRLTLMRRDCQLPGPVLDVFERWVRTALDDELFRVDVLSWAEGRSLSEDEGLELFLHAAAAGIFELSWGVLCPACGMMIQTPGGLRALGPEPHCRLCRISFPAAADDQIEVTFSLEPSIRKLRYYEPGRRGRRGARRTAALLRFDSRAGRCPRGDGPHDARRGRGRAGRGGRPRRDVGARDGRRPRPRRPRAGLRPAGAWPADRGALRDPRRRHVARSSRSRAGPAPHLCGQPNSPQPHGVRRPTVRSLRVPTPFSPVPTRRAAPVRPARPATQARSAR